MVGSYTYTTNQTFGGDWGSGENLAVGNYASGGTWHTSFVDCVRISNGTFDSSDQSSMLIVPVLEGDGVTIGN